jgi:hypothetical protein
VVEIGFYTMTTTIPANTRTTVQVGRLCTRCGKQHSNIINDFLITNLSVLATESHPWHHALDLLIIDAESAALQNLPEKNEQTNGRTYKQTNKQTNERMK